MSIAPSFFLPNSSLETSESDLAILANMALRPAPELSQRIYSITFTHKGEEWKATVGKQLHGVRRRTVTSGGTSFVQEHPVSDPASVLAIFAGVPYVVVTDHGLHRNVGSKWENPFMAGLPKSVTSFST